MGSWILLLQKFFSKLINWKLLFICGFAHTYLDFDFVRFFLKKIVK